MRAAAAGSVAEASAVIVGARAATAESVRAPAEAAAVAGATPVATGATAAAAGAAPVATGAPAPAASASSAPPAATIAEAPPRSTGAARDPAHPTGTNAGGSPRTATLATPLSHPAHIINGGINIALAAFLLYLLTPRLKGCLTMLNLLRSDLYRITRPRHLRGLLWQYGLFILCLAVLETALLYATAHDGIPGAFTTLDPNTFATSPVVFLGAFLLGAPSIAALAASFGALELFFADLTDGYIRTVVSSLRGRMAYLAEKILIVGVWSALILAVSAACHLACFVLAGFRFAEANTAGQAIGWFAGSWLVVWALSVVPLALALITRIKPLSYGFAFVILCGFVSQGLQLMGELGPELAPSFAPVFHAMPALAAWMPSAAMGFLAGGGTAMADALAPYVSAVPGGAMNWAMLTGILWLAIGSGALLAAGRRRAL